MEYGSGDYLHAGCWSHARRKFVDSIPENDKNSKAAKAVEIIDRAFALEREAGKANVPPEKILEMRQKGASEKKSVKSQQTVIK